MVGDRGAAVDGEDGGGAATWLSIRSLTIAGGTSEVCRNQIGERLARFSAGSLCAKTENK